MKRIPLILILVTSAVMAACAASPDPTLVPASHTPPTPSVPDPGPPVPTTLETPVAEPAANMPANMPAAEPEPIVPGSANDPWGPIQCDWQVHPFHHYPCPAAAAAPAYEPAVVGDDYVRPAPSGDYAGDVSGCWAVPASVVRIESGCQNIPNAGGSGCDGYYQICEETWDGYGGYPNALSAPKEVQDAKAAELAAQPNGLCVHWAASGGCG